MVNSNDNIVQAIFISGKPSEVTRSILKNYLKTQRSNTRFSGSAHLSQQPQQNVLLCKTTFIETQIMFQIFKKEKIHLSKS